MTKTRQRIKELSLTRDHSSKQTAELNDLLAKQRERSESHAAAQRRYCWNHHDKELQRNKDKYRCYQEHYASLGILPSPGYVLEDLPGLRFVEAFLSGNYTTVIWRQSRLDLARIKFAIWRRKLTRKLLRKPPLANPWGDDDLDDMPP